MATLDDLTQKAADLQAALDAEQAQIAGAIGALEATVADLKAQVAAGQLDPAKIDAIAASLDATISDLKSTIPDEPPVV